MNKKSTHSVISALAIIAVTLFGIWWFNPLNIPSNFTGTTGILDVILFLLVSYIIWHPIVMEVLTWAISSHIQDTPEQAPKPGYRVAFITTIVPKSEPIDLLHKCLPAMVNADYPHDTWILDEGNSPEVKEVCKKYGVYHFSRHGITAYNMPHGKFAAKTKGGNHNSWYDSYGDYYDIVAQIDTDFVPEKNFLTKTLGYFSDPKVAFVGTPQIYGNTRESFIARGAAEQQYSFYGTVLRGLSGMNTTLLIGANHIVRVAALKSVNHYSAHITEDLITGMKLHEAGWKSVYVPHALAIGEGPTTWEAYLNQQMRWAYGCIDILFKHSPKLYKRMGLRRTLYYFFLQQHYFSGIAMALSIFLLVIYFVGGIQSANVDLLSFFTIYSFVMVVCWLMSVWLQHYHVRKTEESGLLVAGKVISIAAWPTWFLAFISVLRGKRLTYKVTPKGEVNSRQPILSPVFIPHFIFGFIALAGIVISFFTGHNNIAMLFWAAISVLLMFSVPFSQDIVEAITRLHNRIHNFAKRSSRSEESFPAPIQRKNTVIDCIFLAVITCMSFVMYVQSLGFYSDDWAFIGNFELSLDQSLVGLIQTATTPNTMMRPVQNIYDAFLYWMFGLQPFGYHLINSGVLVGIAIMIYLSLKRMHLPRVICVAIPLVYIMLPHYATDRFWYAAFQVNLSMLLYSTSFYAALRSISPETIRSTAWKTLSVACIALSALSYEVILPLYLFNMFVLLNPAETIFKQKLQYKKPSVFIVVMIITLIYILEFKFLTTTRLSHHPPYSVNEYPTYVLNLVTQAFNVNYITYIFGMPRTLWIFISHYTTGEILALSCFFAAAVFIYLYYLVIDSSRFPSRKWMRNVFFLSFVIFILGYLIFLSNTNVGFSPTGVANRVAFVAALGVSLSLIGGIGWLSQVLLSKHSARFMFTLLITVICTYGFITINTLSLFWAEAYTKQQEVLADITTHIPVVESETTILLDGVCPYVGPASVFETEWDLNGALQIFYDEPTLKANIVTPRLAISKDGFTTSIYGVDQLYPFYSYGKIIIYDYKSKTVFTITNREEALYYFEKINPGYKNQCPSGTEGRGVDIL